MAIRWKQSQIYAGVDRLRSNAIRVKCGETIAQDDILCITDSTTAANGCVTVGKADANILTRCRGPFFVADFGGLLNEIVPIALPWKVIKSVNTSAATQVGDAVWLSAATSGGYTLGAVPGATAKGAAFSLAVKIGRVLKVHATDGVIMLNPGMADGAPLIGRVTLGGTSTTVLGFTAELDGSPCVVTPTGATADHATQITATIASGTLTLTHDTATDICSYMIQA